MEQEHVMSVIRKHWDVRSSAFNIDHDADTINRWENVLLDLLGADRNKSVVDLGTGTGFLANITGKLGYPTIGIDISKEILRYAVQRGERCGSSAIYMEGNASNLPFVAGSIDYIINARFLWTLMEPEKTFMEWYRIIKPGGGIVCFNTMKEGVGITVKQRKRELYHDKETDSNLKISGASIGELKELIEKCGFSDVEIRRIPELGIVPKDNIQGEICDYEPWFAVTGRKEQAQSENETG